MMTAALAATILWCLDSADDNPASDCGFTEAEVACVDSCTSDDESPWPAEACPGLCFTRARVETIREFPLYRDK